MNTTHDNAIPEVVYGELDTTQRIWTADVQTVSVETLCEIIRNRKGVTECQSVK